MFNEQPHTFTYLGKKKTFQHSQHLSDSFSSDGPDFSPPPGNYRLSPQDTRSCMEIVVRADQFYEDTEALTGHLVALVDENGATVTSIRGVTLSPDETEIQINDIDGM